MKLDRECDWVIKHKLIEAYRAKHDLPLTHPKVALIDLQYHDISRQRGLFYKLQDAGHGRAHLHRRRHRRSRRDAAADHPRPAARRVHPPGQGAQARLHGRLGAPEAQRPGAAHRALQGPVPSRATSGSRSSSPPCSAHLPHRHGDGAPRGAARAATGRHRPRSGLRAHAAHRHGGGRRPGGAQHHRRRPRPRHRRLARRALEHRPRGVRRARARATS